MITALPDFGASHAFEGRPAAWVAADASEGGPAAWVVLDACEGRPAAEVAAVVSEGGPAAEVAAVVSEGGPATEVAAVAFEGGPAARVPAVAFEGGPAAAVAVDASEASETLRPETCSFSSSSAVIPVCKDSEVPLLESLGLLTRQGAPSSNARASSSRSLSAGSIWHCSSLFSGGSSFPVRST